MNSLAASSLEAILLNNETPHDLVRELERARHADLPKLVLPLETRTAALHSVMVGLASAELFLKGLDGELGRPAHDVASQEAYLALAAMVTLMNEASLIFQSLDSFPTADLDRDGLSKSDSAVLVVVAKLLAGGRFLDEALDVFDATDRALHRAAHTAEQDRGEPLPPSALAATLIGGSQRLHAAILIEGCEHAGYDYRFRPRNFEPIDAATLEPLISNVEPENYSRLYFLSVLINAAEHQTVVHLVPTMLRKCWASRAYHLRLQGLQTTQFFCREAVGVVREEIVTLLESFDVRNNIALSSMVVEILSSYGLIDPPGTVEGVLHEIHGLLGATPSEEVYRAAYGIYGSQFEDVVAEPYFEAIDALPRDERLHLLTLAAQGAGGGFFADTILHELLQARDPRTLPAFEHWARNPDSQSFHAGESIACYSLAMQGWAYLQASPPQQSTPASDDEAAWQCYGQLIFWLCRPKLDHKQVAELCARIWARLLGQLSMAAIDPLYRLAHASSLLMPEKFKEDTNSHELILRTFPGEIRRLLEHALGQVSKLTSLYRHRDRYKLAHYILSLLGSVGDETTIGLLAPYVDDPCLGPDALRSIKNLRAFQLWIRPGYGATE